MNSNIFYYQTDAFENQEDNKDQNQNIDEQIEYFLSDQFSNEEKKIKIQELVQNLQEQLKKTQTERDQWKEKYEKQIKKIKKLQNFSKEKVQGVNLTRSFTRHKSPKKHFHSNISIKKSPNSKRLFQINFDKVKKKNVASNRKSLKPSRSMKSSSVNISMHKKQLKDSTTTLQKYKKFVQSIGKIILQFKPKDFNKQSSQSLQEIWKWLKQHFEEYIDLKMKVIKYEKKSNNNSIFIKIKKLFKGQSEEEILKQIKIMKTNLKILEQIFQKSQSQLGFKNSKKTTKNYQRFDKFLDKNNKQLFKKIQQQFVQKIISNLK